MTKTIELAKIMGNVGRLFMANLPLEATMNDVRNGYAEVKEELREIIGDMSLLSIDELLDIGCIPWDDKMDLYLIPLWAFDFVLDGTELTTIDGEKKIKGTDTIFPENRLGSTAWGFVRKEEV